MSKVTFKTNQSGIGSFTVISTSELNVKMFQISREIKAEAAAMAAANSAKSRYPRTFKLSRSFGARPSLRTPRTTKYRISNKASYARYVFAGTKPIITPKKGPYLIVGRSATGLRRIPKGFPRKAYGIKFREQVRGQTANNIPMKATAAVFARRGLKPRITQLKI